MRAVSYVIIDNKTKPFHLGMNEEGEASRVTAVYYEAPVDPALFLLVTKESAFNLMGHAV